MTNEQNKNLENSESEVIHSSTSGSGEAAAENGASLFPVVRRGTGPRTGLGKERSKRNARKHGLFAEVLILPDESRAEFDALWRGLRNDFKPVGTFEKDRVEMLAVTRWQQRRLLIAEGAEIQAGREFPEWDESQREMVEAGRLRQGSCEVGLIRRIAIPEVLQRCLELLKELSGRIEQNDFDTENDEGNLRMLYVGFEQDDREKHTWDWYPRKFWQRSLVDSYQRLSRLREGGEPSEHEYRNEFLREIAEEMKRLERYKQERASVESNRRKLEGLRRSVPDSPRLDQLLRYAAYLERTFDRTLSQLERAQRMRLGQPTAPRIDVNVSSS
jgi:hypothetical protein